MPVFRAEHQIGDAIVIPVDGGGTGIMAGEIERVQVTHVFEQPLAIAMVDLLPAFGIVAIDQDIQAPGAFPVREA